MIGFKEKWGMAPEWQKDNYLELEKAVRNIDLTEEEKCKLLWLGFQDLETRKAFMEIFKKLKEVKQ